MHADLRSRKDAPHRLGLIDMNVAIGLDAQPCRLEPPGRAPAIFLLWKRPIRLPIPAEAFWKASKF
jgi:hypothetical protein